MAWELILPEIDSIDIFASISMSPSLHPEQHPALVSRQQQDPQLSVTQASFSFALLCSAVSLMTKPKLSWWSSVVVTQQFFFPESSVNEWARLSVSSLAACDCLQTGDGTRWEHVCSRFDWAAGRRREMMRFVDVGRVSGPESKRLL